MKTILRSLLTCMLLAAALDVAANNKFGGVNLSGAEFGSGVIPGTIGVNYIWPTTQELDYFHSRGLNIVRVAFQWERMQASVNGPLNATYLTALDTLVDHAAAIGVQVIVNPHNFARYGGNVVGSSGLPNSALADLWSRLAMHYLAKGNVIFGLMNEPNSMPTEQWLSAANAAIAAIRAAGAQQLVLVPGNAWTGAHSWAQNWYGTPNSTVMLGVVDSGNHFAFELHQYFDSDSSGTNATCLSASGTGANQLQGVTNWLRANGYKGFLGEFSGANNTDCHNAVISALTHLKVNADVWSGWLWWAAGPWWGEYMFTLEPTASFTVDRPQMAWLAPYLPPLFADGFEN